MVENEQTANLYDVLYQLFVSNVKVTTKRDDHKRGGTTTRFPVLTQLTQKRSPTRPTDGTTASTTTTDGCLE